MTYSFDDLARDNPDLAERLRQADEAKRKESGSSDKPNGHAGSSDRGKPAEPYRSWTLDDMLDLEPPAWVVEGVVPFGGRVLKFGPSGHHKTNLAVDMSCHIAHGLDFHGHKVAKHPVLIVATEDPHGAAMRVVGWHDYHSMPTGRVVVVPDGEFRLNDPDAIARLRATAEHYFPGEKAGYVIDHYDLSVNGDPTSTVDAKNAAEGLRALGSNAAFVLLLAHAPWTTDERAKVPVSLWANVDARLRCERDEATGQASMKLLHQKNGRSGAVMRFEFEMHEFGMRNGSASCLIARLLDESTPEPVKKAKRLGPNEQTVYDSLTAAICDHGRELPLARDMPQGVRGVRYEDWEAVAMRHLTGKEAFRKRENFKRAASSLCGKRRMVCHADGWCWLPKAASHASHGIA